MQRNQHYIDRINAWGTFPGREYGFEEVPGVFELNGFAYEGNTIYIRK